MAEVKTAATRPAPKGNVAGKPKNTSSMLLNLLVVVACIVVGQLIFYFVLGAP